LLLVLFFGPATARFVLGLSEVATLKCLAADSEHLAESEDCAERRHTISTLPVDYSLPRHFKRIRESITSDSLGLTQLTQLVGKPHCDPPWREKQEIFQSGIDE
jgi:hypothetical protein